LKYRNAKTVLPERLVRELQQYVQGQIIYVPGDDSVRAGWGESNGTREKYDSRNNEIIMLYRNGVSMEAIAGRYHLSEYSIKKIIYDSKYNNCNHRNEPGCAVKKAIAEGKVSPSRLES